MPSLFTATTSPVFLIPGCLLLLGMAGALLVGYQRTRQRTLLWVGLGLGALAALALAVQSFFVLLPGYVLAFVLYVRAATEPDPPAPASVEVVYRVWASQARVHYRTGDGATREADVQGAWEHRFAAVPGTPLGLSAGGVVGAPLVAELWCDGVRLDARHAPPEAPTATLGRDARAARAVTA